MINLNNGKISFSDGFRIDAHTDISSVALREYHVGEKAFFQLGIHPFMESEWGVGAVCIDSKLSVVELQKRNLSIDVDEEWNLVNEEKRKVHHDLFLRELTESAGVLTQWDTLALPWGRISSVLDLRGVQALIVVEYMYSN